MKSFPPGNRGGPKVQSYHMSASSALSSRTLLCGNCSWTVLSASFPLNKPLTWFCWGYHRNGPLFVLLFSCEYWLVVPVSPYSGQTNWPEEEIAAFPAVARQPPRSHSQHQDQDLVHLFVHLLSHLLAHLFAPDLVHQLARHLHHHVAQPHRRCEGRKHRRGDSYVTLGHSDDWVKVGSSKENMSFKTET